MDKLIIEGGVSLNGEVVVSGAKNSSLPIMAAALLTSERCIIRNVPDLRDVHTMIKILRSLGAEAEFRNNSVIIEAKNIDNLKAGYKMVSTMRASFCVLGPLLGRFKKAEVSFPGGCVIGLRPVNLHIKGLLALGVDIKTRSGYVIASAGKKFKGATVYLGGEFGSTVLGTINIMMAAVLCKGKTVIEFAACEPEVVDTGNFLKAMGAEISGLGTPVIEIKGVSSLRGVEYEVISDRIEAGTFMLASAITNGNVTIKGIDLSCHGALIDRLRAARIKIREVGVKKINVKGSVYRKPVNLTTQAYPGFPTDMQAQFMSLMSVTSGVSVITEKIYPDRFMHIAELNRMGARIRKEGSCAIIEGVRYLSAAEVMASDLRASAALVLAGLVAKGKTKINRIYHLDRGYESLDAKLSSLGARITRKK
ncbi:MAG: UDP-N-acetylglucosamine 1-carboxyvinyltransferase [Candidatus Gygaella obscura]|nr:UDP-N-acetylglucosamine 1-carboxyvinyltransferase [Candidatus Gygaella obscura]